MRLPSLKGPMPAPFAPCRKAPAQMVRSFLTGLVLAAAASGALAAAPIETAVETPAPLGLLKGTRLDPAAGPGPVVLIIPGSGPTDRNGDNPYGVKAATYRLLAEALAAQGVSTVRIDKRGMFASAAAAPDADKVTIADYAGDALNWVAAIRKAPGVPCVWLLGHSEGSLVATVAAKGRDDVCGLILVAGPGRRLGDVLREQLKANPANAGLLGQALSALDALEAGKRVDVKGMDTALLPLFRPQVQGYLIDLLTYDPAKALAGYPKPVLILSGARDLQVGAADAAALKGAQPSATLLTLPDVNHVLKTVTSDDAPANFAAYGDPSLPLAPGVEPAIRDFLVKAGVALP